MIWFLVDRDVSDHCLAAARGLDARVLELGSLEHETIADTGIALVDVDLSDLENVRLLRRDLAAIPKSVPRIFAIDEARRIERVHANVLGANFTTNRPLTLESARCMIETANMPPIRRTAAEPEPPDLIASLDTASETLGELFGNLLLGEHLQVNALAGASTEIAEAIKSGALPGWLDVVRHHHKGTYQHCLIVTGVLANFGWSSGMSRKDVSLLTTAGLLHDIGKARIPLEILDKPAALTPEEFEIVKTHPAAGADYLKSIGVDDRDLLAAVRSHHELLDGSGYPDGLSNGQVGDIVRILTICDIYGALVEQRAYRPPMAPGAALGILYGMAGAGQVEAALVRALEASLNLRSAA